MKSKFWIVLAGGFLVLSTISAATGNFAVRLEQATRQVGATQQANAAIAIDRIMLTERAAAGYRQVQARSNVIAPGTPFNIYFEPTGLATRFENGAVRASMSVDILVRDSAGQTVASRDNAWQLPLSRQASAPAPLQEVYGDLMLNHLTFADGRYQIVLRIHDDFAGTFVDRTLDVEIRTPAQAASARLSQAAPRPAR